ncbi:MAG: hypothetical protein ACUVRX_02880 [Actinomycetota bacterium]
MGRVSLIVLLGALGTGVLCLAFVVRSALLLYRTLLAAYDDYRVWATAFAEAGSLLGEKLQGMEGRARNIIEAGDRMRESVEDIQDTLEELRSSPVLRAARFIGERRSRSRHAHH